MADVFTPRKRSEVMARIRSRGNKDTELFLLKVLRKNRIAGWRRHLPLLGKPDFAFPRQRLALFVDGCFWHGCPRCYRRPDSRTRYWDAKLARNKQRDRKVTRALRRDGWRVVRIWEHELKDSVSLVKQLRRSLNAGTNLSGRLRSPSPLITAQNALLRRTPRS